MKTSHLLSTLAFVVLAVVATMLYIFDPLNKFQKNSNQKKDVSKSFYLDQDAQPNGSQSIDELLAKINTNKIAWYQQDQVELGKSVFVANCAVCHGVNAVGTKNWKIPNSNGDYPPPPLNGTAHTWHHRLSDLYEVVTEGQMRQGGNMPAFKTILSRDERIAVLAYISSLWPQEIYDRWATMTSPEKENLP